MNPLAVELNSRIEDTVAFRLMSPLGKRMYFPKGIIAQSAEAKKSANNANATIGMAFSKGKPLILSAIAESMPSLKPEQSVVYAPTAGFEDVRKEWKKLILQKNQYINAEGISLPVVVSGLTAGLSLIADLFLPEDCVLLASEPCWDNYTLIFEERGGGKLESVPFFDRDLRGGLDLEAIGSAIRKQAATGAVRIILNFPNNPSGYTPDAIEAKALAAMFLQAAESGADVLVLCDDAYFGLFYEDTIYQESIFSLIANLHERILAVKIDGPIKEDYVWGLRTGFVTFGSKGLKQEHYDALVTKLMGAIRSSVSCANTPAQHIIIKALGDPRTPGEKQQFQNMMQGRYNAVKAFLAANPDHPCLTPLPFNSGYFMSFYCSGISAESLRKELLAAHGIGVISLGEKCLRVAFSSLDEDQIIGVYKTIYATAAELKNRKV